MFFPHAKMNIYTDHMIHIQIYTFLLLFLLILIAKRLIRILLGYPNAIVWLFDKLRPCLIIMKITFHIVTSSSFLHLIRRFINKNSRNDTHSHELLEQQLTRIGNMNLREPSRVLAEGAAEGLLPQVGDGDDSAVVTYVYAIWITVSVQTIAQKVGSAVGNKTK